MTDLSKWEKHLQQLASQVLHDMQRHPAPQDGRPSGIPQAPIVELVNELLEHAILLQASDIHIEPQKESLRFRYRLDGMLKEDHPPFPPGLQPLLTSRLKILAKMDTSEHRKPLDGHITYSFRGEKTDFRVASMPVCYGKALSIRLLNSTGRLRRISELDMSKENERSFRRLVHAPSGMFIVTGPMNSGKTTALYAALQELNTPERNLMTLEDPVEQLMDGINQIEVSEKTGLDFAKGLRAILRMDADCIMVGEMRDVETARIALRAALTGHLLLTTLHAKDSCTALFRLLEMGLPPYLLAAAVTGIVSQRLVRRICPECSESYEPAEGSEEALLLGKFFHRGIHLYRGRGCPNCHGTGFRGRLAIHEILPLQDELRTLILQEKGLEELRQAAVAGGLRSMQEDGIRKALQGLTTFREIRRVLYGD